MKKLILGAIALSIITFSCNKEEVITQNDNKTVNPSMLDDGDPDMPKWEDNGAQPGHDGIDFGCFWMYGECLPTVTITPSGINNIFDQIISDVDNGTGLDLINTFTANSSDLSEILGTSIINNVISGNYTVKYRGENTTGHNLYLIFSVNDDIVLVKPMAI